MANETITRWTISDRKSPSGKGPNCSKCGMCDCPGEAFSSGVHRNLEDCPGLDFFYFEAADYDRRLCEICAKKEGLVIIDCIC